MFDTSRWVLALTLMIGVAAPSYAMSIDEFDGETASTSTPFTIDGTMLGGERDVFLGANATFESTGGLATSSFLTGIAAVQVYYDGDDDDSSLGYGLGGVDLTAGGADRFLLSVTGITGSRPSISLTVFDSVGNSVRSGPLTLLSTGVQEFLFSSFTFVTGSGASLSNANALQITFSDNTDVASGGPGSVTVDYLRTNGDTSPVPEPSSVALMGLGLVACGLWRRKRNG